MNEWLMCPIGSSIFTLTFPFTPPPPPMPPSGRPYTRQQLRTDRAFLAVAAVCFLITLLAVALMLRAS